MLKNWTITTQAVRGSASATDAVMARERYLLAANHPNHRTTESIISLIGNAQTSQRIALLGEEFRLKQQLSRKGGRPISSFAIEYCLVLPKLTHSRPTPEQWKQVLTDCCKALVKLLELKPEEIRIFRQQIRAVLHQQNQSGKRGAGDHVHLIIGKVLSCSSGSSRVLKELQKKRGTKVLKQAFNAAVLKHVGIDHREYQPYELNRGKRLETWKYQARKAEEASHTQKLIAKLQMQADKWFQAREEHDARQQNRQLNRLLKTFETLSSMDLPTDQRINVDKLKKDIESKSRRKFPF